MGAGVPQVDMGAIYQFFVNMIQAGVAIGVVGRNSQGGNQEVLVVNNYVVLHRVCYVGRKAIHWY